MNNGSINRTGERVLGIIGIVFNVIGIILLAWMITGISSLEGTPEFEEFQQEFMNDPAFQGNPEEAQMVLDLIIGGAGVVGWIIVAMLVLSTIFAVVAVINLKNERNIKIAGIFFILAGLLAGVLSLTSILFYIAAIMCFVRKPPMREEDLYTNNDPVYRDDATVGRRSDTVNRRDDVSRTRTDDMLRKDEPRRDDDTPYRPL